MTAPELSPAELVRLDRIDAADDAPESLRERVVDALYDVRWPTGEPLLRMARGHARRLAEAAIAAITSEVNQ